MNNNGTTIKSLSIRIPIDLLNEIHYIADYEGRSVNSQILYLLRQCSSEFKKLHGMFDIE